MAKTKKTAAVEPPPIGELIDALYQARNARLSMEKQVEALKAEERAAKDAIMARMHEMGLQKASGAVCTAAVQVRRTVALLDWPTFWAWARKDKVGNYLQKRVAVEATRELIEAGQAVPGAQLELVPDLSLTKMTR